MSMCGVQKEDECVRHFAGFGTTKGDKENPDIKARTQSFLIRMACGRVRFMYKRHMHQTQWRPTGPDGPAVGWRVFRAGFAWRDLPQLQEQPLHAMAGLGNHFRHLDVRPYCMVACLVGR